MSGLSIDYYWLPNIITYWEWRFWIKLPEGNQNIVNQGVPPSNISPFHWLVIKFPPWIALLEGVTKKYHCNISWGEMIIEYPLVIYTIAIENGTCIYIYIPEDPDTFSDSDRSNCVSEWSWTPKVSHNGLTPLRTSWGICIFFQLA